MKYFTKTITQFVVLLAFVPGALAETLSVPLRWCAVEGSPAADSPELFNDPGTEDPDTDTVLWRRHERPTDNIFLPQADITFRSALWNIVQDADLSFPIIADPCDPSDDASCPGQTGDILTPVSGADTSEWNDLYNACVDAWSDPDNGLDGGNVGIVIVNVRRLVDTDGDRNFGGYTLSAGPGSDTFIAVEDYAFRSPDATDGTFTLNSWRDDVGFIVGHEAGHRLGIGHVCDSNNLMDWNGADRTVANDNFRIETSVDELQPGGSTNCGDSTTEVDQVEDLRDAAENVPGCKILGTNQDCTNISDVVADAVGDAPNRFLDLSLVYITELENGLSSFEHQLHGPVAKAGAFSELNYYLFADLDNDTASGGAATDHPDLTNEITFAGADLITRVRVTQGQEGGAVIQGKVWRWEDGSFVEVDDDSIKGRLRQRFGHGAEPTNGAEIEESHVHDMIAIEFDTDLRGPAAKPFRLQAMSLGLSGPAADSTKIVDILDAEDGGGGGGTTEDGRNIVLVSPTFPICRVEPEVAEPGELVKVKVQGLLAKTGLHVVFGDLAVAQGETDFNGGATVTFQVPGDARDGKHLVTVGSDGTALTADCPAVVQARTVPEKDKDTETFCLLCLAVIGILGLALILLAFIVFFLIRRKGLAG